MCDYTPVADFYKGESVFITGGTGFLGKVVIEKILYSCPGIDKIYVLMRKKQHSDVYQRLQDVFKQQMFTRLKNLRPEALDKIIPVTGDISEANLGLSAADEKVIRDNVSIIFHVAANVKFHEPLEVAMNVNVMGTFRALELFRRLENRKAFVYVSTAYTNFERKEIEEKIYPAPASIKEVKTALENGITEDEVKELLKCKPNTYVFTKSIAESFVAENHVDLPITIVRPSIISSCQSEPIPGWIDTWVGATALMTTTAKGFNRVLFAKPKNSLDLIPVDYVSNLIIVAAAKGIKIGEITVYNSSTCGVNPISIKEFVDLSIAESVRNKFNDVPLPGVLYTSKTWMLTTLTMLLQVIPAFIADLLLFVMGKNTRFSKLQTKVEYIRKMVDFYTIRSWRISAAKTGALAQTLSSSDRSEFPFDPLHINWKEYVPIYLNGVGKFLLNTKKH